MLPSFNVANDGATPGQTREQLVFASVLKVVKEYFS